MIIAINTRFLLKHQMEGVGRFIYETSKRLALNHPEDEFHFLFDRKYDPDFIFSSNVKAKILFPQARSPLLWKFWFELSVYNYLKRIKADVFFSPDTYLSLRSKVPSLLVCHDIAYAHYPEHIPRAALKYYRKYFPQFHQRADKIIAVSQFTKDDIIRTYNLESSKVRVAYNAATERFRPIDRFEKEKIRKEYAGGKPYFVYVGSIHPRKNISRLIQAFDQFKSKTNSNYKLVLVGRLAWKVDEIMSSFHNSSNKESIIFLNHLDQGIEKLVAAAEAMVYVSLHEGFGIPVLEAMHCDVPAITSNTTSLVEVGGDAAILVDPLQVNQITNAMIKIFSDQELKSKLILAGKFHREKFSWDKTSDIIYEELKGLAKS